MEKISAVLFDLDGTITQPCIDFDAIRAEIGGLQGTILEATAKMTSAEKARVEEILRRHEAIAAANSELNPGAAKLIEQLRQESRKVAIITRNSHDSVGQIAKIHKLTFDAVYTREDGPPKPNPFGVLHLCEILGVKPQDTLVVGDYLYDLVSGRRAGAKTVLLSTNENYADFTDEADYLIHTLDEITGIIERIENNGRAKGVKSGKS